MDRVDWLSRHSTLLFYAVLIIVVFIVLAPLSQDVNRLDAGLEAAQAGDYRLAAESWIPLAEHGSAPAQYNLALLYEQGWGVSKDPALACEWYRKAAAQGFPLAKLNLGLLYLQGIGVSQDPTRAVQLITEAAQAGEPRAQVNLGNLYFYGVGVPRDPKAAVQAFRAAAQGGNPLARYRLGESYLTGMGVLTDPVEAYAWFGQATKGDGVIADRARAAQDFLTRSLEPGDVDRARLRSLELSRSLPAIDQDERLPFAAPH